MKDKEHFYSLDLNGAGREMSPYGLIPITKDPRIVGSIHDGRVYDSINQVIYVLNQQLPDDSMVLNTMPILHDIWQCFSN